MDKNRGEAGIVKGLVFNAKSSSPSELSCSFWAFLPGANTQTSRGKAGPLLWEFLPKVYPAFLPVPINFPTFHFISHFQGQISQQ